MSSSRRLPRSTPSPSPLTAIDFSSSKGGFADNPMEDFMIGDRVFVGNKPGVIAYLGDVKFAVGDFAGVVLDEPTGKNDGSVKGTRYFQCEPLRGVFVKSSRLARNHTSMSPSTRSSPRIKCMISPSITTPTSPTKSPSRRASSSSNSTVPLSVVEDKHLNLSPSLHPVANITAGVTTTTMCDSVECRKQSTEQIENLVKEYQNLMSETRQKLEEFQLQAESLEKDNLELHKVMEEQKLHIEDLQFQLEEEVLSKEDVMQELIKEKNNNKIENTESPLPTQEDGVILQKELRLAELEKQLEESLLVNSSLREELEQVTAQLSDIEFQLAESETERENGVKEKKKLERHILGLEMQVSKSAELNQQDNHHSSNSLALLSQQLSEKERLLGTLQKNYSDAEAKWRQLEKRIKTLNSQHNQAKDTITQSYSNEISSIQRQHDAENARLKAEHASVLDRLSSKLANDIRKEQAKHTDQVKQMGTQHSSQISDLQMQHEGQISALQVKLQQLQSDLAEKSQVGTVCNKCTSYLAQVDKQHGHLTQREESFSGHINQLQLQISSLKEEKKQLTDFLENKSQMADVLKQQVLETQSRLMSWQKDVNEQVLSNKEKSEKDLESLRTELGTSQALLLQLEKKLRLSEGEKSRLQSRINILTNDLHETKQALVVFSPRSNGSIAEGNGTYRDTSDFLFNQLQHQVEIMELNMLKATEVDLKLKEENEELRAELARIKQETRSGRRSQSKQRFQPRLFCDTCGTFDDHPTGECTVTVSAHCSSQSTSFLPQTSINQLSGNTNLSTNRMAIREQITNQIQSRDIICDICNSDEHWTADCTVDE